MTARALQTKAPERIRLISTGTAGRPRVAAWVVYTVVVAAVFFGLIYSQTELDGSAFELQKLDQQLTDAQLRHSALSLEVARLSSPARIVPAANDLGMVLPSDMRTISAPGVVDIADATPLAEPLVTASP